MFKGIFTLLTSCFLYGKYIRKMINIFLWMQNNIFVWDLIIHWRHFWFQITSLCIYLCKLRLCIWYQLYNLDYLHNSFLIKRNRLIWKHSHDVLCKLLYFDSLAPLKFYLKNELMLNFLSYFYEQISFLTFLLRLVSENIETEKFNRDFFG